MKVLASGDHHWDLSSRWEECRRVHDWMFETAVRERVSLFISTGDIYDRASLPEERLAVAAWLRAMAEQCPVLVIKGNHDLRRDLELLSKLESTHSIVVEESAGVHLFCHCELAVAAVAWPERARILAHARTLGSDQPEELAQDALRNVLRGLGQELANHKGPTLAAGHFNVDGAVVSTGQPLIGQPLNLGLADLALLQSKLVLMGHIHKPQQWTHGETDILYVGSPYRTAYGELEDKSVVLVTLDETAARAAPQWERLPTPCAAMYLIDEEWSGESWGAELETHLPELREHAGLRSAEIRFRYTCEPDQRERAREAARIINERLLAAGAAAVLLEECVRTTSVARAPEVAAARNLGDKLLALWTAKGTTPEPLRREVLLSMAAELEQEIAT
jgi:exonuclease SbcD